MPDNYDDSDLAALLSPDEPTAQEAMRAQAAALRQRRGAGALLQLSGDHVLAPLGQTFETQAQRGEEKLLQVPNLRAKTLLTREQADQRQQQIDAMKDPATLEAHRSMLGELLPGVDLSNAPAPTLMALMPHAEKFAAAREAAQARRDVAAQDSFRPVTDALGRPFGALNTKTGRLQRFGGTDAPPAGDGAGGATPAAGAGTGLSQQALDQAAELFHRTGNAPLARGKGANIILQAIQNRAAELHPEADLASNKAGYKADTGSLAKLQAQADSIDAFENTAIKNLDAFLASAKGVADVGSPLFNKPIRVIADSLAGSPRQAQFNAARRVAIQEIGKVLGGAVAGGAISDSQRHEVEGLMRGDATLEQLTAVAQTLKSDMENRKAATHSQIATILGRTSGKGPVAVQPAAAGSQAAASVPRVTSQAEYDALPAGADYVDANGAPHRKGGKH